MTLVAVADAGPLIHLAEIESLDLLSHVETLYIPETVVEELDRGGSGDEIAEVDSEIVSAPDDQSPETDLDPGERAALAVATDRKAVLLTDDLEARDAAKESGVEVHGSIGVIALAHARGSLDRSEAAERMRALQYDTSLFVTEAVVERGIEMLDERS
ncbi:nucleic acid-binding protein [Halorientalis sp. IM1011]|uniref:nucleic acid-binding protein n=1 Tax=Halorientalis sp. IM1011 TaxID=1932360 RepID=UPI00097CCE4B|nr:nucleic acid-binding protein [Halorientalis sp. IM1011]AQL41323.1 nucleic acid-binding protein [Halorientalis sp. IM1011]